MKHLLITTIAAVLLVGCSESQQSAPQAETKPAEPVAEVQPKKLAPPAEAKPAESVAEATQPDPLAAEAPDISITQAAETGDIEAIKQHLAAGADVNTMTASLHRAAYNKHKEIIELLIANGVDVNAKNDAAETPLHLATTKEIAELLIANGADVNATTNRGTTPLDWAANDEIASIIRKHGGKSGGE